MGIKEVREAAGLSQFTAAKRAGMDRTRLSLAESGHVALTAKEQAALRRVLVAALRKRLGHLQNVLTGMEPLAQQAARSVKLQEVHP